MDNHSAPLRSWLSILYRYGRSHISKVLEPYNIGSGQYIFLMVLLKNNGISQEELSDYLKIDKATTAKAVRKLEQAGLSGLPHRAGRGDHPGHSGGHQILGGNDHRRSDCRGAAVDGAAVGQDGATRLSRQGESGRGAVARSLIIVIGLPVS